MPTPDGKAEAHDARLCPELVGTSEAAEILQVERPRVGRWLALGMVVPEPVARLRCGPVWTRAQIDGIGPVRRRGQRGRGNSYPPRPPAVVEHVEPDEPVVHAAALARIDAYMTSLQSSYGRLLGDLRCGRLSNPRPQFHAVMDDVAFMVSAWHEFTIEAEVPTGTVAWPDHVSAERPKDESEDESAPSGNGERPAPARVVTDEQRKRTNERRAKRLRERYATDPEYAEAMRAKARKAK